MHSHIDYWLAMNPDGKKWGVDVKGNNLPDEIWVEFKNVRGNDGWLYGGATIIAFDMPEEGGFSIVDREELAFFVRNMSPTKLSQTRGKHTSNATPAKIDRTSSQSLNYTISRV